MEGQTANPWLIMAINMTVVFAVLILLGVLMEIIHMIDPTKKKKVESAAPVAAAALTGGLQTSAGIRSLSHWQPAGSLAAAAGVQ